MQVESYFTVIVKISIDGKEFKRSGDNDNHLRIEIAEPNLSSAALHCMAC